MSLLFESIACQNGVLLNIGEHEKRLNSSRKKLMNSRDTITLATIQIPEFAKKGLWKCRVSYDMKINNISFTEYQRNPSKTFLLVESTIEYPHKYDDRSEILDLFNKKGSNDDIIITVDNLITDSSIGNLIFYDGSEWVTPSVPLLHGTMRAQLIKGKAVKSRTIHSDSVSEYESFMMINALNPFDINRSLPIKNIKF